MDKKTILIVEDSEQCVELYQSHFDKQNLLIADNFATAHKLFNENKDQIDIIVMDAQFPKRKGSWPDRNGPTLTLFFRQNGFTKPIIAASSDMDDCKRLVESGCSHNAEGKRKVPQIVLSLL